MPAPLTRRAAALAGAAVLGVVVLLLAVLVLRGGAPVVKAATVAASSTAAPSALSPPLSPPPSPGPVPVAVTPTATTTTAAPRSSSVHLVVPSVGLDVAVLPLTPKRGVIDPPTMVDSYWIKPYGEPGSQPDNTVYIAGHSWTKGAAAFNPLMPGNAGSGVSAGDVVQVRSAGGTVDYTVTSTERYDKDALPGAADVWAVVPGRLVLITCFVDDDGHPTDDNFVVFADS